MGLNVNLVVWTAEADQLHYHVPLLHERSLVGVSQETSRCLLLAVRTGDYSDSYLGVWTLMPRTGEGPVPAKLMLVGEAFGADEERTGTPFVGVSGQELNRMLHEAGIMRTECYLTNVVNARPPRNEIAAWIYNKKLKFWKGQSCPSHFLPLHEHRVDPLVIKGLERLNKEISLVQPNLIVALGNTPLWALTGLSGILRWRASMLTTREGRKLIPVAHPAAVLRQFELRTPTIADLRRCRRESAVGAYSIPDWSFIVHPPFERATAVLVDLGARLDAGTIEWIDFDLETARGHIDCAGVSWSRTEAICIPFMTPANKQGYWSLEEEATLIHLLYRVLTHPRVKVRGQNLLFDCQYTSKHWMFIPRVAQDTMISQHTCYCAMKKSLDFQASLYCDYYVQWKRDKSAWKEQE